jgi:hydrogenase maturation protease
MNTELSNNWKNLVIGYGNDLRGDDAAGIRAAEKLAAWSPGSRIIITHQLTPELACDIAASSRVVFVDAVAARDHAALHVGKISTHPARHVGAIGHHGDPSGLLQLTSELYGAEPDAWLVGIPAFNFQPGEALSPGTAKMVDEAVGRIGELIGGSSRRVSAGAPADFQ